MYFRKISIHGFKSFADPITIEFDRGITCVVGPNGSGKSNIFDALRWVLGEQSPKTLRGGKMDEVIFAGTASRKSRGMAEVSLLIDNSDASLPVDFSEVEITRRMYRSAVKASTISTAPSAVCGTFGNWSWIPVSVWTDILLSDREKSRKSSAVGRTAAGKF